MSSKTCWLCLHCDLDEVVEMMNFVECKSPVMHVEMIASQVCDALKESFVGQESNFTEEMIINHICRHVVTPVASVTRITRDLLDICESLKPTLSSLRAGKRRRLDKSSSADEMDVVKSSDGVASSDELCGETPPYCADNTMLYLRTVGQVMAIYRMHHKLLSPESLTSGSV